MFKSYSLIDKKSSKYCTEEAKLNEKKLVKDARNGDHDAFKALIKKYEAQVAATVIGMIGQGQEAEDIGQETFIRFYRSLKKFRGDSSVGTYLTRIAINLSINEIKRRQKRRNIFFSQPEEKLQMAADTKTSQNSSEAFAMVHNGIQKLAPKFRSILVLRLIDGYTTQETARTLNLPLGTVLSRLARGQAKLKEILAPAYQGKK